MKKFYELCLLEQFSFFPPVLNLQLKEGRARDQGPKAFLKASERNLDPRPDLSLADLTPDLA